MREEDVVLRTGLAEVDSCLPASGLALGWLVLVAGASESGKTALSLELARRLATDGTGVLYAALKESGVEIAGRLLAQSAGGDPESARRLLAAEPQRLPVRLAALAPGADFVEPLSAADPACLEQLAADSDVQVLFVDDLGALLVEGRRDPELAAQALSRLAQRRSWLVVALDDGSGHYGAGLPAPEQLPAWTRACDLVLFTSRPAHLSGWPAGLSSSLKDIVAVELARNRHGRGTVTQVTMEQGSVRWG